MATRGLKLYCSCGSALDLNTNSKQVVETVERLWNEYHKGEGHKAVNARTASHERNRLDVVALARSTEEANGG